MKRSAAVWLAGLLLLGTAAPVLAETVLEKISRTGVLVAGTRGSAIPFAYINEKNQWIGFSIDLLEAIHTRLEKKLGKRIKLEKKEVLPTNRMQLVANRTLDIECSSTTYTRGRDETVDFSISFFFTGTQLLVKKGSGIKSLADVAGKRVGVARESTGEKALRASQPKADMVTFQDHAAGVLALEQGRIVAYATDGFLLAGLVAKSRTQGLRGGGELLHEGPLLLHSSGERLQVARLRQPHLHGAHRQRKVLRAVREVVRGERRRFLSHVGSGPQLHDHAVHARVAAGLAAGFRRKCP
jgi:ABC-type amino acid transport substrate-binding protein